MIELFHDFVQQFNVLDWWSATRLNWLLEIDLASEVTCVIIISDPVLTLQWIQSYSTCVIPVSRVYMSTVFCDIVSMLQVVKHLPVNAVCNKNSSTGA